MMTKNPSGYIDLNIKKSLEIHSVDIYDTVTALHKNCKSTSESKSQPVFSCYILLTTFHVLHIFNEPKVLVLQNDKIEIYYNIYQ